MGRSDGQLGYHPSCSIRLVRGSARVSGTRKHLVRGERTSEISLEPRTHRIPQRGTLQVRVLALCRRRPETPICRSRIHGPVWGSNRIHALSALNLYERSAHAIDHAFRRQPGEMSSRGPNRADGRWLATCRGGRTMPSLSPRSWPSPQYPATGRILGGGCPVAFARPGQESRWPTSSR